MKKRLNRLPQPIKKILVSAVRNSIGRLPPSPSRLTGELAKNGGKPVRDIRLRPWADSWSHSLVPWYSGVSRSFKRIFVGGIEGLPQPLGKQFSQKWADYCGCRFGVLLANGTDALSIGLAALLDHDGLGYGGEVIVPNYSFIATASAALDRRFGVAFVDVDPVTLLLDPERVEEAIIPGKTRAIIPVHLFGQPSNMTALRAIADKRGLKILEDAAQAHGAIWETGRVGSLGHAAAFSFQSSKNLSSGEGGALTTNDEQVFERAYSMHNVGRPRIGARRWEHMTLGWNCRATEYQAALLIHRLAVFDRMQAIRRKSFQYLRDLMADVSCLEPLGLYAGVRAHGMYMFAMRYRQDRCGGISLEDFLELAQAEGVPVYRAFSSTMSDQPAMQNVAKKHPKYFRVLPTPVADQAAREVVFIPQNIFLGTANDMEEIVAAIKKVEFHCANSNPNRRMSKSTVAVEYNIPAKPEPSPRL
jgi:dTDP-4-amino-4,6-dideoxygalactose transaminase